MQRLVGIMMRVELQSDPGLVLAALLHLHKLPPQIDLQQHAIGLCLGLLVLILGVRRLFQHEATVTRDLARTASPLEQIRVWIADFAP